MGGALADSAVAFQLQYQRDGSKYHGPTRPHFATHRFQIDRFVPGMKSRSRERVTKRVPYHCDGILVPSAWSERLQACTAMSGPEWDDRSDHNPLVVELNSLG